LKTGRLGRLAITLFLTLAVALTLNVYNLPTGIGERLLQRTTRTTSERTTETREERTTTTPSRSSSSTSSTNSSSSGPCPAGVVCSSSSSGSTGASSSSGSISPTFRTIPSTSVSSSSGSLSLTFRTIPSSRTIGGGCSYLGIFPGRVRNTTVTTTIFTILSTRTNQTNSTVVETTCAIPGFPLEAIAIGMVMGLLFVIMSRSRSRRLVTN
jgi:hypothetical protein